MQNYIRGMQNISNSDTISINLHRIIVLYEIE